VNPPWLTRYYGPEDLKTLSPTILFEGRTKAVLMLRSQRKIGMSLGYILVSKNGKNNVSTHESLHEGFASSTDIAKMRRRLSEVDGS
jgi:hypothetical protein